MIETLAVPSDYHPPAGLLAGRAILVTGAGQGLGRAVALLCAALGANVALLGRKGDKLEATADAITTAGGAEPALVPLDLAKANAPEFDQLAQMLRREFKRLDGIVHCASHLVAPAPLAHQTLEQWTVLLRVNLAAPVALTRACLPLLSETESSVVITGETHGLQPAAYWGALAVAASALPAVATIWASELEAKGRPRINVLVPGPVDTPQRARTHPGEDRSKLRSAASVAGAYAWLLGPDSGGANGKTFTMCATTQAFCDGIR